MQTAACDRAYFVQTSEHFLRVLISARVQMWILGVTSYTEAYLENMWLENRSHSSHAEARFGHL